MRILLVEDDEDLSRRLASRLLTQGFIIDTALTAQDALDWPDLAAFNVLVLDLGLPDGDGLDVLRQWRARGLMTPVIVLTARGTWQDKVAGLNAGADDFVVKPVRFEELLARLHALSRRPNGRIANQLENAGLILDLDSQLATLDGAPLALSRQELRLLRHFMDRPGHMLSQDQLVDLLYDLTTHRDRNSVEVLVSRLRRKIGKHRIATVRGLGYCFR